MSRFLLLLLGVLGACARESSLDPGYGVSLELARERAARIRDLRYALRFTIPADRSAPVTGSATIHLSLADRQQPLVLDFRGDSTTIAEVEVNGATVTPGLPSGHVVIPAAALLAAATIAAWLPARVAARVDPLETMR